MFESAENYLETILILEIQKGTVHSVDVANYLGFSKPSVSRGVNNLIESGLLTFGDGKNLVLTPKGREEANRIYDRHVTLTKYLQDTTDADRKVAEENACLIEHIISDELYALIKEKYSR